MKRRRGREVGGVFSERSKKGCKIGKGRFG